MYHPRFKGTHYEIGLKYGYLLKQNKIDLFGLTKLDDFQTQYGIKSEKIVQRYFPDVCDEIRGMAEGVEVPYQRFAAWLMCISVCLEIPGCSMMVVKNANQIVFGRNNDLPPIFRKISASTLYDIKNGFRFILNSSAFVSGEEGINNHGLAIGMTYVWAKELQPGINSMFFVRCILESCTTVEEGVSLIQKIPIGGAYHLILADRGDFVHLECSPQKIKIHHGEWAVATNHFLSDEMHSYEEPKDLYHSYLRYQTGKNACQQGSKINPIEFTQDVMSGKKGFICQYKKSEHFETVWSSIFALSQNKIYRVEGNPARKQYVQDIRLK